MPYIRQVVTAASEERLEKLIQERLKPGADKEAIDARVWGLFGEQWAVMFTDLSGFSRRVAEFGIIHFLQIIYESQRILVPCIDRHDGILLKSEGDSLLVIFRSPRKAIDCAVAMQQAAVLYNRGRVQAEQVLPCLGLGYGRVLRIGDSDVFGAEVNAAEGGRLQIALRVRGAWRRLSIRHRHPRAALEAQEAREAEGAPAGEDVSARMEEDVS